MKKQLLFFFFLVNSFLYSQEAWHSLGPDDFTDLPIDTATFYPYFETSPEHEYIVDIAIDNNNVPYIVYQDGTNANKITVRKFNGTFWEVVGIEGFSAGEASDPRLAIDSNNVPYVAYIDAANGFKATLQKFNGTAWEVVGTAGFSVGEAYNMNLEIDGNNVPYVGFTDVGFYSWPMVWRFNGTEMEMIDPLDLQADFGEHTVMALDSNNKPYLVFQNTNGTEGRKLNDDGYWEWLGLDYSLSPYGLQMAIDANNVPYVVFLNTEYPNNILKVTIRKLNGATWELVGPNGISGTYVYHTDIAIDANNVPFVAYQDGPSSATPNKATVQKFNGTAWEVVGTAGFSAGTATDITIAIGANNVPYVVYVRDGGVFVKYLCSSTFSTDVITACDSYTWIDGNNYTESNNTATHILTNAAGCDSVVTLNLIIDSSPDVTISSSASTLTVDLTDAIYQWLDCDNAFAPIEGENDQIFVPQANGNYAVIVEDGACSITSECVSFEMSSSGISENFSNDLVMLYPNPTNGEVTIELKEAQHSIVEIYNSIGAKVNEHFIEDHINTITIDGDAGIYFVKLKTDNSTNTFYVLKQ